MSSESSMMFSHDIRTPASLTGYRFEHLCIALIRASQLFYFLFYLLQGPTSITFSSLVKLKPRNISIKMPAIINAMPVAFIHLNLKRKLNYFLKLKMRKR